VLLPEIPVAAVQPTSHDRVDFDLAWPRILRLARDAAERGAKLIVLPEATVPGYVLETTPVVASQLEGAARDVGLLARRTGATIVYGGAKIVRGRTYNAAICVGPSGDELGFAAKQFLWHFDRRWFDGGETLQPIDTPLGPLGLLVCADGRIPTIAATLVERGARALVMPTAWVTSGRDPHSLENAQADLMAFVRARENGVPFVVANKCGVELGSVAYCGKSAILDARGEVVARASETREEIVFGAIELASPIAPRHDRHAASAPPQSERRRERARIAFTTAREASARGRVSELAGFADCDLVVARDVRSAPMQPPVMTARETGAGTIVRCDADGDVFAFVADDDTMHDPRGLVAARLVGIDLVLWFATAGGDPLWQTRFARTRAAELRAFVIVFDGTPDRAFAVDPDGVVVAGTFGDFRMAAFVYDRARTAATIVAPTTDVMAGLRLAERIRDGKSEGPRPAAVAAGNSPKA
jgi:predicted amidohydrolase